MASLRYDEVQRKRKRERKANLKKRKRYKKSRAVPVTPE